MSFVVALSVWILFRWWIAGMVAMIPGAILIFASALALAADLETVTHGNWNSFMPDDYSRTMGSLIVLGSIFTSIGIIVQFVAWIGALMNTRQVADWRWFNAVFWGGVVGIVTTPLFGLGALISGSAMIAYLRAGPDGTAVQQRQTAAPAAPPTMLAPTS